MEPGIEIGETGRDRSLDVLGRVAGALDEAG